MLRKETVVIHPVKIEKKFIVDKKDDISEYPIYRRMLSDLHQIPGVKMQELTEWTIIVNEDIYFEPLTELPNGVAMRHRVTGDEEYYYVKISTDDRTTNENKYHCENGENLEEFLELVTELFISRGCNIGKIKVKEGVKITTERFKSLARVKNALIEISFDFSIYEYESKKSYEMMLKCKLKEGDDISLWYLTEHLKNKGFIEINESKEMRAKKALGIN